jgi:hypothetical protein
MRTLMHAVSIIIIVLLLGFAYGQDQARLQAEQSIRRLLMTFQEAAVSGAPVSGFFSQSVRTHEKDTIDTLQRKGFVKFGFLDYTFKDLQLQDADHATLPVTVRYSTRNEDSSRTATLTLVREQGAWYFAKADFWQVSFLWFLPMIAYGALYGCGVVIMYWHSNRQKWPSSKRKALWELLFLVPFSVFFYFARKPWETA